MAKITGTSGNETLTGTAFKDSISGLAGNDILNGSAENDILSGGEDNDTLNAGSGSDILNGGNGNDLLKGGNGDDLLIGTSSSGVGQKDTLTGGAGRDRFVLGTATRVLYDDGNSATAGRNDYALISDFNLSQDVIQLKGQRSNYRLAASPSGLPTGTAIYRNKSGSQPDELIGIIQNRTGLSLNSTYFQFVGSPSFKPSDLDGSNGFVINGVGGDYFSGSSVSSAGDINGDGFDDLIVGAPGSYPFDTDGESYVVFGQAGGFGASLNLSDLNGSNGFVINGINYSDYSGDSVSTAGDINGDGFDDLLIGARNAAPNSQYFAGESYVVFGQAGGFGASLNLSDLNGSNGFVINGIDERDFSGTSVSTAGDINGDGFDDLIVGAPGAAPNGQTGAGESYVVFGQAGGFDASLNLSDLDGSNGFVIKGMDTYDLSGRSVSSAGDINGDGLNDLLVGASGADANGQSRAGESYVVFGQTGGFDASLNLSDLDGSNGFVINGVDGGDYSGRSVSSAGDINGDGFDDLLVGAPGAGPDDQYSNNRAGESYVVFGQAAGFGASLNLSDLNGSNGFVINGINYSDYSGTSVSTAGDINGDGFDDLIVGAGPDDQYSNNRAGESYVVFGQAGGFGASLNLSDLNGSNGFVINGINYSDYSDTSVSTAGDINGDGFDDLIVGVPYANGVYGAGESYVVLGRDFTGQVTSPGTAGNDLLTGTTGQDFLVGGLGNDELTGTSGNDILVGGLGNDKLVGGQGIDVLKGGSGNDLLSFSSDDRRIDGGSGIDTLSLNVSSGTNLDLTTISNNKITEFEKIDITGAGNNTLKLTRLDLLDLSDTTNQLIVNGNGGDKVTSTGQGWMDGGTTTLEGILYDRYTAGVATLLVDTDITQMIS